MESGPGAYTISNMEMISQVPDYNKFRDISHSIYLQIFSLANIEEDKYDLLITGPMKCSSRILLSLGIDKINGDIRRRLTILAIVKISYYSFGLDKKFTPTKRQWFNSLSVPFTPANEKIFDDITSNMIDKHDFCILERGEKMGLNKEPIFGTKG